VKNAYKACFHVTDYRLSVRSVGTSLATGTIFITGPLTQMEALNAALTGTYDSSNGMV
jgi:hypothetical protein